MEALKNGYLYLLARKNKDSSVTLYEPSGLKPARPRLTIKKHNSSCPDYRNRYIVLNCYRYALMWDKS